MTGGLFIHVQHLLGIGHQQRMDAIATACAGRGLPVTMATGEQSVDPATVGYRVVGLPDLRAADAGFSGLVDMRGAAVDDAFWGRRLDRLRDAFRTADPAVLLVEGFPFARRQFRRELIPLLEDARRRGAVVLSSIRDILQPKTRADRIAETLEWIAAYFDGVLVHGDPAVAELALSFARADAVSRPVLYTGYVSPELHMPWPGERKNDILVSAGGGAVGADLYRTALDAARQAGAERFRWRLRIGRNARLALPAQGTLPGHVSLEEATPDFRAELAQAALSISQAGYNTAVDLMATRTPAILTPFADAGQQEQTLRAERMAELFGATVLNARNLTPELMWNSVRSFRQPGAGMTGGPRIDLDGAARTARIVEKCLQEGAAALTAAQGLKG